MEIRRKARDERALIANLERRITDQELKRALLQPAIWSLEDVEGYFLAKDILNEQGSLEALSRWLDRAQAALDAAIGHRKHAETAVAKFGFDATLMTFAQAKEWAVE